MKTVSRPNGGRHPHRDSTGDQGCRPQSFQKLFPFGLEARPNTWCFCLTGTTERRINSRTAYGIMVTADTPFSSQNVPFQKANGRFETNKKICLSISGHHPETWQPSWSIRTALLAIIGFMPTPANGTIGSLDYTAPERQTLAKKSPTKRLPKTTCLVILIAQPGSYEK
ncbi:unnamed protein product, partial [Meganyctiphanes norvegica]